MNQCICYVCNEWVENDSVSLIDNERGRTLFGNFQVSNGLC